MRTGGGERRRTHSALRPTRASVGHDWQVHLRPPIQWI